MPVWGFQANSPCGVHGVPVLPDEDGNPIRSWGGCEPNPCPFCSGLQDASYDAGSCATQDRCGDGGGEEECGVHELPACISNFTSARPYLDKNDKCNLPFVIKGFDDPARIDFVNNVIVYRAPILWENHSDEGLDDDYTMNLFSPGHELEDQGGGQRVHVEFDSDETIDHFIPNFDSSKCFNNGSTTPNPPAGDSFGAANLWWRKLRCLVDQSPGDDEQTDRDIRCFMKSLVNPTLTCPQPDNVDPSGPNPMAVVVGIPSLDCADHPKGDTVEIHPAYAVAIRIQESTQDHQQPEQWAFFYRDSGDNGACGSSTYRRCGTTFQLPLALPFVPAGQVLTGADVHVDFHPWAVDDSFPSDVTVNSHFDLANGTVLTISLPGKTDDFFGLHIPVGEGVVGLVTVTPVFDTTPPQITCPDNITSPTDLGKCTAAVTFAPTVSDDCSVNSVVCSPPSGTAFPLGTTTDTCTATDQARLSASCSFTVTITAGNKCPLGQPGYWKNHTDLWAVNSLTLGSVTYTKDQLIDILNSPSTKDASVILAKQLIAALLNLANGSNPVPVCNTIGAADGALDGCTVPCAISSSSPTGQAMLGDANSLELFNLGKLTTACAP
jgi:hypothetical protein